MSESGQRFYSDEEAEQILRLASSMSDTSSKIDLAKLVETAAELGISAEAVEKAERQLAEQKQEGELRLEFHKQQRLEFFGHLYSYLVINAFLVVLNVLTGPKEFWAIYPIAAWGMAVVLHGVFALSERTHAYSESYSRWRGCRLGLEDKDSDENGQFKNVRGPYMGVHYRVGRGSKDRLLRERRKLR